MILKFRAWEKNMNTLIPVENIDFLAKQINTNSVWRMFHEIELMQSTGLIDVNDVEIYEGDIVKLTEKTINGGIDTHTCKVFQSKSGAWRLEGHPDFSRKYTTKRELYSVRSRIEIIGNFHENPEFMEVQE